MKHGAAPEAGLAMMEMSAVLLLITAAALGLIFAVDGIGVVGRAKRIAHERLRSVHARPFVAAMVDGEFTVVDRASNGEPDSLESALRNASCGAYNDLVESLPADVARHARPVDCDAESPPRADWYSIHSIARKVTISNLGSLSPCNCTSSEVSIVFGGLTASPGIPSLPRQLDRVARSGLSTARPSGYARPGVSRGGAVEYFPFTYILAMRISVSHPVGTDPARYAAFLGGLRAASVSSESAETPPYLVEEILPLQGEMR